MNLFEIAALKDRVLKYLDENINPSVSVAIYMELKLEILPYVVFNEYLKEMDRDDVLHINEMSGNRHLLFITDKGRRLLFEGGYVKTLNPMTKKEKLHRIVEFLSIESNRLNKSSFNSGEIAKAFIPELEIPEINFLCKIIISKEDLRDCTSKDESAQRMIAVLVITATHDAYYNKKYLEEDELFTIPSRQNIITGENVIVGNISGDVKQVDNAPMPTKTKEKPKWLKWFYWILGALVLILSIIEAIFRIF